MVFVVFDTLRADHLGAYGSSKGLTPNLDELAERSVLFENALATSSWTRPSVASMLTSRYPAALGIQDDRDALRGEVFPALPALLKERGFQTFGTSTNGNTSADFGFGQGFDAYELPDLKRSYPGDFAIPIASGVTRKALELLDRRVEEDPFFLFVHYVDPHDPYLPHPDLLDEPEPGGRFDGSRRELSQMDATPRSELTEDDLARIRHLYAGEVKYADRHFGRLLQGLRERGLDGSVLVVATSDHGEGLWDHGIRFHGVDLYQESIGVPLIVHFPGMTPGSAKRISAPVSLLDLAPTILAALGIPAPDSFQGRDLSALAEGRPTDRGVEALYAEMDRGGRSFDAIRTGSWKLITKRVSETGPDGAAGVPDRQIFDLAADPEERVNLAGTGSPAEGPLEAALAERERFLAAAAVEPSSSEAALERSTIESLKALGYLDAHRSESSPPGQGSVETSTLLDFEAGDRAHRRSLEGFQGTESEARPWLGFGGRGSISVDRDPAQGRWSLRGYFDPSPEGGDEIAVAIRTDGAEPAEFRIEESGWYWLEGSLPDPPRGSPEVRFDIHCERAATPGPSVPSGREACLSLSSLLLY